MCVRLLLRLSRSLVCISNLERAPYLVRFSWHAAVSPRPRKRTLPHARGQPLTWRLRTFRILPANGRRPRLRARSEYFWTRRSNVGRSIACEGRRSGSGLVAMAESRCSIACEETQWKCQLGRHPRWEPYTCTSKNEQSFKTFSHDKDHEGKDKGSYPAPPRIDALV